MAMYKVLSVKDIDSDQSELSTLPAYIKQNFTRPIQYHPDPNGNIEEQQQALVEKLDQYTFRVERRGQFVNGVNPYLNVDMVQLVFKPFEFNGHTVNLMQNEYGLSNHDYHIHCDPAKVNDDFAVMVAHGEQDASGKVHTFIDWYNVWRASDFEEGIIMYNPIMEQIKDLITAFNPVSVTFDQFNSVQMIQALTEYVKLKSMRTSVYEETATAKKNLISYENMKLQINSKRVHSYEDSMYPGHDGCMLQSELASIQSDKGKIVKVRLPGLGHDDLVDCLANLISRINISDNNLKMQSSFFTDLSTFSDVYGTDTIWS